MRVTDPFYHCEYKSCRQIILSPITIGFIASFRLIIFLLIWIIQFVVCLEGSCGGSGVWGMVFEINVGDDIGEEGFSLNEAFRNAGF